MDELNAWFFTEDWGFEQLVFIGTEETARQLAEWYPDEIYFLDPCED